MYLFVFLFFFFSAVACSIKLSFTIIFSLVQSCLPPSAWSTLCFYAHSDPCRPRRQHLSALSGEGTRHGGTHEVPIRASPTPLTAALRAAVPRWDLPQGPLPRALSPLVAAKQITNREPLGEPELRFNTQSDLKAQRIERRKKKQKQKHTQTKGGTYLSPVLHYRGEVLLSDCVKSAKRVFSFNCASPGF